MFCVLYKTENCWVKPGVVQTISLETPLVSFSICNVMLEVTLPFPKSVQRICCRCPLEGASRTHDTVSKERRAKEKSLKFHAFTLHSCASLGVCGNRRDRCFPKFGTTDRQTEEDCRQSVFILVTAQQKSPNCLLKTCPGIPLQFLYQRE